MNYKTILVPTQASDIEIEMALAGIVDIQNPEGIQIAIGDQTTLNCVAYTRWHEEDLANALEAADFPITKHNIEALTDYMEQLEDMQVHDGWETLSHYIWEADHCGELEKNPEIEDYNI